MFKLLDQPKQPAHRSLFITMLVFGVIGLLASFALAVDEFRLLKNPDIILTCSFNFVLNCSAVMQTWQASVFGFPNMLIGLMAFPVVIMVAVIGLARASMPRWFWVLANVGYLLGAVFAYWLFFSSLYVIQVLCPWCLVVTFSTTLLLATITHFNLRQNAFGLRKELHKKVVSGLDKGYGTFIVASWIVILIALVFLKFGRDLFS